MGFPIRRQVWKIGLYKHVTEFVILLLITGIWLSTPSCLQRYCQRQRRWPTARNNEQP